MMDDGVVFIRQLVKCTLWKHQKFLTVIEMLGNSDPIIVYGRLVPKPLCRPFLLQNPQMSHPSQNYTLLVTAILGYLYN